MARSRRKPSELTRDECDEMAQAAFDSIGRLPLAVQLRLGQLLLAPLQPVVQTPLQTVEPPAVQNALSEYLCGLLISRNAAVKEWERRAGVAPGTRDTDLPLTVPDEKKGAGAVRKETLKE
jgi:hypothetical protein